MCRPVPSFATDRFARRAWLVSGAHLARGTLSSTPTIPLALVVSHPFLAGSPYPCTTPPFVHDRRKAEASKTRLPFPLTWESDGLVHHALADFPWAGPGCQASSVVVLCAVAL